jgi:hypothetical protein
MRVPRGPSNVPQCVRSRRLKSPPTQPSIPVPDKPQGGKTNADADRHVQWHTPVLTGRLSACPLHCLPTASLSTCQATEYSQDTHKTILYSTQGKMLSQQSLSQAVLITTCGSPSPRQRPHCRSAERAKEKTTTKHGRITPNVKPATREPTFNASTVQTANLKA